ncbi:MAG: O-antigen ligase family protein [Geobacteraceae bacterium]
MSLAWSENRIKLFSCFFTLVLCIVATVFIGMYTELSELAVYFLTAGVVFFALFYRNQYYCLYFYIIWLPLQAFVLSGMAATGIFSDRLIIFLSSLKELALVMVMAVLLLKGRLWLKRLTIVDWLFLLNVVLILVYAILPDSVLGVPSSLKVKAFGLRSALITLIVFLVGRTVPYDSQYVKKGIRLLTGMCILIAVFGVFELLFVPRKFLIAGLVPYNVLKGGDLENLLRIDLSYEVEYIGFIFKRMMSFFLSPLSLAYFLILPLGLTLAAMRHRIVGTNKILLHAPIILFLYGVTIILSSTRGVIVTSLIMLILVYWSRHHYKKIFLMMVPLGLILALSPMKQILLQTINLEDPSARAHLFAYTMGVGTVLQHPFGIGLGQAGPTAVFIKGSQGAYGKDDATVGESLYLTMAAERGLPSVVIFCTFAYVLALTCKKLSRESRDDFGKVIGSALFISTIGFMVASIPTEHWLGFQSAAIYWWFAGVAVQMYANISEPDQTPSVSS